PAPAPANVSWQKCAMNCSRAKKRARSTAYKYSDEFIRLGIYRRERTGRLSCHFEPFPQFFGTGFARNLSLRGDFSRSLLAMQFIARRIEGFEMTVPTPPRTLRYITSRNPFRNLVMQRTQYRIGIDVGGTFTDFLLLSADGSAALYKTLTTPHDPAIGLMNGLQEMADDHRVSLADFVRDVELIVHGTTVATNAVLTGNGTPTGLLTTEGFRDAMQMRRGIREAQYDNHFQAPDPLVPRYRRLTAKGRVNYAGEEEAPLDIADVCTAAEMFRRENVAGIALCFMHAHANASHEQQAAEILRRELPNAYLSVSSELLPQIRFYDRTSTTVLNAYVGPLIQKYLTNLQARLSELNFQGVLLIMQSNGGVASPDVTMRVAAGTLLSGPAAGPVAGLAFVEPHGRGD